MPTFAESLSQGRNNTVSCHIRQNALFYANAIKYKCLSNQSARCVSGFISSHNNEPSVSIIDRLSYAPSASEAEKKYQKSSLHKPSMVSKSHLYQDTTGKCFGNSVLTCTSAEVNCYTDALKEVVLGLGFTKYKITPHALKHIERTTTPATLFTPVKVVDKVVGLPCYMFHIEIRW